MTLDVKGTVEGRTIVDDKGIEFIPSMENKLPLPGFSVMLEGSKKGDDKTFTLPVPEDSATRSMTEGLPLSRGYR